MKVKVLCRNPDDYQRETKHDIHKVPRNYSADQHPFHEAREYVRALNATKLERVFAKPFVANLDGHRDGVYRLAKHPQRLSIVLTGSYDGEVKIWHLPTKTCLATVAAHAGFVRGLCVDPHGGDSFVTIGDDCQLKQWRLPDPVSEGRFDEPVHSVGLKAAAHDVTHNWHKAQFATCGEGVDVWEHERNTPIRSFEWGVDTVHTLRYNPVESDLLLGAASDRSLILYDCRGQAPLRKVVMKLRPNGVCWNPMEAYTFTAASEDYSLYTFDMRKLKHPLIVHKDFTAAVMDVDYAPTGKEFVAGGYDKSVRIYPSDSAHSSHFREVYHTKRMQRVMSVLWSMDNKFILSGSDEMNVRIWKARASEKLGTMKPREERAARYSDRLKEKFGHHPEVRRIARHRHVPKHVYSAAKEHRIIRSSQMRKEANLRAHSAPGTVPDINEKKKSVVGEQE